MSTEAVNINDACARVYDLCYFVSGQVLAFDQNGLPVLEFQKEFTKGDGDPQYLKEAAKFASKFSVASWEGKWVNELSFSEFTKLLNLHKI